MKNIKRLERILNKFNVIWTQYPEFRFFQFLSFIRAEILEVEDTADLFYMEDYELEEALDNYMLWKIQ